MIVGDMQHKCQVAREKVQAAIALHGGTTLLSTGITGDDARLARAAVEAGARMLEPNHPALALARGYKGVTSMHDAEELRHEVPMDWMVRVAEGVRNVVGPEVFITIGVPGSFTETVPMLLSQESAMALSRAGADGLHVHKSTLGDLKDVVDLAHSCGLTVDAYIGHPKDRHIFGIPAETPAEVADVARKMQEIGTDFIGLMTGMSYEGVAAGEIAPVVRERLVALVEAVDVPTLAEGGINTQNFLAFRGTGVNVLVVGTALDDMARKGIRRVVRVFLP
ncbi:MAG: histidine biosynthesis protein [Chloroflexota bacterium]